MRNKCYDWNILSAVRFDLPTIAVGNLTVGGSGKTPHVEYLIGMLEGHFRVATLSRGYRRNTRGYQFADEKSTAQQIGDEPMQFHLKFPDIAVAVGENRMLALPQILMDAPDTQVVLLDDAFQHRSVLPGMNILVTEYHRLFTRDFIVPAGRLRESRKGYKRADLILVSKCPPHLSVAEKNAISSEIAPLQGQGLYFTTMQYGTPYHLFTGRSLELSGAQTILLVTGIEDPAPARQYLLANCSNLSQMKFPDHYNYKTPDLEAMVDQLKKMEGSQKLVLTTEKDAVKLKLLEPEFSSELQVYVLPIRPSFLFDEAVNFRQRIFDFITYELKRTGY